MNKTFVIDGQDIPLPLTSVEHEPKYIWLVDLFIMDVRKIETNYWDRKIINEWLNCGLLHENKANAYLHLHALVNHVGNMSKIL